MKELVNSNLQNNAYEGYYVKCICGLTLTRKELRVYFDNQEIDSIFYYTKFSRNNCLFCKNPMNDYNGKTRECKCGIRAHDKCGIGTNKSLKCPKCRENLKLTPDKLKTPCCNAKLDNREFYVQALIDLAKKKEAPIKNMPCPFCTKISDITDIEKILTKREVESIKAAATQKVIQETDIEEIKEDKLECSKCKKQFVKDQLRITLSCEDQYHPLCAKELLSRENTVCLAKGCSISDRKAKIKECENIMENCCSYCERAGTELAILGCKHFVCYACIEDYSAKKNDCISNTKHSVSAHCKVCNKNSTVTFLKLKCDHNKKIDSHRMKYMITGKDEMLFPTCTNCSLEFDSVEINALLGRDEAAKLLKKVETILKQQVPEPQNNNMKGLECSVCNKRGEGFHRFMCKHIYICFKCIKETTLKIIEEEGLAPYCRYCYEPTNLKFLEYAERAGSQKVTNRIKQWKTKNLK